MMSDEIPADIRVEAASLAHDLRRGFFDVDSFEAVIGFALLSERERCAKVADDFGHEYDRDPDAPVASSVASKLIAQAIRTPTPEAS
jgi:hypothetical protein